MNALLTSMLVLLLSVAGPDAPDEAQPTASAGAKPSTQPADKAEPKSQEKADEPSDDLDRELLDDLDRDLRDDLDRKLLDDAVDGLKERPTKGEQDNPLLRVGRRMRQVEDRLAEADPGEATRKVQKQIVEDLDALIDQLKKQGQQSSSSQQQQQQQQQQQRRPTNSQGQGENQSPSRDAARRASRGRPVRPQTGPLDELAKTDLWGHLPEKLREQMMQAFSETFLPRYEAMLNQYYKTLADRPNRRRGGR